MYSSESGSQVKARCIRGDECGACLESEPASNDHLTCSVHQSATRVHCQVTKHESTRARHIHNATSQHLNAIQRDDASGTGLPLRNPGHIGGGTDGNTARPVQAAKQSQIGVAELQAWPCEQHS